MPIIPSATNHLLSYYLPIHKGHCLFISNVFLYLFHVYVLVTFQGSFAYLYLALELLCNHLFLTILYPWSFFLLASVICMKDMWVVDYLHYWIVNPMMQKCLCYDFLMHFCLGFMLLDDHLNMFSGGWRMLTNWWIAPLLLLNFIQIFISHLNFLVLLFSFIK